MLKFLSLIFELTTQIRNYFYDKKLFKIIDCGCPVISIGNISVGGSGKTPFVILLSEILRNNHISHVIIGRGYKRKSSGLVIVRDENEILTEPEFAGDEMYMLATITKVPVVVHQSKTQAALIAFERFKPEIIILDDGFQHRKLKRDLDLVLVDNNTINNPELLPKGLLRENISSLKRAYIIILRDSIELNSLFYKYIQEKPILKIQTCFKEIYNIFSKNTFNKSEVEKVSMVAVSGISHPEKFENSLSQFNLEIKKYFIYRDHHNYTESDISEIIEYLKKNNLDKIITTEKDAVKFIKFEKLFIKNNIEIFALPMRFEITSNFEILINNINKLIK